MHENYKFIQNLESLLLNRLVPGAKQCDVYAAGLEYARKVKPNLVDHLEETFGFAIGIDFHDSSLVIDPQCTAIVREDRVFNVCVGLTNLTNTDASEAMDNNYALYHGDTVVVNESGPATILTTTPGYLKLLVDCWWQILDSLPSKDIRTLAETCKPMNLMANTYIRKHFPGIRNKPFGNCLNIIFIIFDKA